jgi:hypothetical protein
LQEYLVPTSFGHISVTVCGDLDKPALVTYPDVGLNCKPQEPSCFYSSGEALKRFQFQSGRSAFFSIVSILVGLSSDAVNSGRRLVLL